MSPCRRSQEDFDDCLLNHLREAFPKVSKEGLADEQLPPFDPFYVPELLTSYEGEAIKAKTIVKNSYTHGFSNMKFLSLKTKLDDPENMEMEIEYSVPRTIVEGTYKVEGLLSDIPIAGKGVYNISMTNITGKVKVEGYLVKVNGEDYLRVHKVGLRPKVGTMKIYASNLVNGNPELSAMALAFANQFWKPLYEEMLPYVEEGFDKIFRNYINKYTMKVPYDTMFPK